MNRNETLSPELIKARETIAAMKQEFADKMILHRGLMKVLLKR